MLFVAKGVNKDSFLNLKNTDIALWLADQPLELFNFVTEYTYYKRVTCMSIENMDIEILSDANEKEVQGATEKTAQLPNTNTMDHDNQDNIVAQSTGHLINAFMFIHFHFSGWLFTRVKIFLLVG